MTDLMPNIASVTDLQRNYRKIVALSKKTGEPVVLLKKNKPEIVLYDYNSFKKDRKRQEELELKEVLAAIKRGEEEVESGKIKELKGSLVDFIDED